MFKFLRVGNENFKKKMWGRSIAIERKENLEIRCAKMKTQLCPVCVSLVKSHSNLNMFSFIKSRS